MSEKINALLKVQEIENDLRRDPSLASLSLIQELANNRMSVPIEFIRAYDRAKKRYKNVIVLLINGVCQGCFLAASTGVALIAKSGRSIHVCEHCMRLLYCETPPAKD